VISTGMGCACLTTGSAFGLRKAIAGLVDIRLVSEWTRLAGVMVLKGDMECTGICEAYTVPVKSMDSLFFVF